MIKYINVLLSNKSVSFCHYTVDFSIPEKWISPQDLSTCVEYAKENQIGLNFIFPKETIPQDLQKIIDSTEFMSTKYFDGKNYSDINVIEISDIKKVSPLIAENSDKIFVVLFNKDKIEFLSECISLLKNKFKRLSFVLTDIETFTNQDIEKYENELQKAHNALLETYKNVGENFPEINFISDRWFLKETHSCNAGIDHFTLAPNGEIYLCPAFYYKNFESIGKLGKTKIENAYLLDFDHAPICKICDAHHCNRCVFLNRILTNEFNTPSMQQCVLSHIEREESRKLLDDLHKENKLFWQIPKIPEIDYIDPLDKMLRKVRAKN